MDIKFNKDEGSSQKVAVEEKGKQNVLLVVLLVLVAAFGYIYFFTGLIKPTTEQKVAEAPPAAQVVKKPLPSPNGEAAKTAAGGSDVKKEDAAPVKAEPAKAAPAAPAAATKPVTAEAAKPKEEPKKAEAPQQPAVKKPLPVAAKTGENKPAASDKKQPAVAEKKPSVAEKKPAVAEKKPAVAEKKPAVAEKKPAVAEKKPAVEKKPLLETQSADAKKPVKKEPVAPQNVGPAGTWTVLVGNYVLEEALAEDLSRVRKAGVPAFIVRGGQKKSHMNRLQLAEFTDRASAQIELDKLKRHTSDAFMIDSAGMHVVYAGSYLLDARAMSEKARLTAAGFSLTLKRADVAIPTKNLTAGSFTDKNAAEDTLKKLRAAGVKATLSR